VEVQLKYDCRPRALIIIKLSKKGAYPKAHEESHFALHVSMIEVGMNLFQLDKLFFQNEFIENTKPKA
jgi:hypothetical protein